MSEEALLCTFKGWYLIDLEWNLSSGLRATLQSPDEAAVRYITFQTVQFLNTGGNASKSSEMANHKIHKFEEIKESRLLPSLSEKDGDLYLIFSRGDSYEGSRTSPGAPGSPRHFVLLTDYADLEVLCTGYTIAAPHWWHPFAELLRRTLNGDSLHLWERYE